MSLKVFLVGEGRNELGSMAGHPSYQSDAQPGVIQALLTRVRPAGWTVVGAREWKSPGSELRVQSRLAPETQSVLRFALDATESGADVLVFLRDDDDAENRRADVSEGLSRARINHAPLQIVGGVAIQKLEAWILALRGKHRTEQIKHPETALLSEGLGLKDTVAMVGVVLNANLDRLPSDAHSLRDWLQQAHEALGATT